jgi:prepilin-type N-terminal cleavage/methylation domain-containing protein
MNTKLTHNSSLRRQAARGFTLIEMIGVLAVIAILAALLIPKVFSAIAQARVNGVTVSTDTIKTALVDHYGKYGNFDQLFGTNAAVFTTPITTAQTNYDGLILMTEALIDKPFNVPIATSSTIEICAGGQENGVAAWGYQLDGITNRTSTAQYVIEAKLTGVSPQDAKDLNDRIDGTALGAAVGTADKLGRVEYQIVSGSATVYVYLTSR